MIDEVNGTNGLKTAVETEHDPCAVPPGVVTGEQPTLLPLRNAESGDEAAKRVSPSGRGRGRPPGAKNKNTEAWRNYLLSRYASPLEVLASIASRPLPDLMAELMEYSDTKALTKTDYERVVELLKIQLGAAKELAPYLHQKQPMAIDTGDKGLVNLFIGDVSVGSVATSEATDLTLDIIDIESEENQGVSESENQKSNGLESNDFSESYGEHEENADSRTDHVSGGLDDE